MQAGEVLEIIATDGQAPRDFRDFCREGAHDLLASEERDGKYIVVIRKSE